MSILIAFLIAFLGYVVYLIGICLFKGAQHSDESDTRTLRIMLVELIMPVLYILVYAMMISNNSMTRHWQTPVVTSILLWVVSLVATIYLIAQYNALSKEPTWDNTARRGAANLKASYQYLIWIQVVIIAGCLLMAWTVFSTYSDLASMRYSSDSMYDVFDGVNRLQKIAMDFTNSLKIESMFTGIAVVILSLMWAVSRISGWYKIKSGNSSEEYAYTPQAEPDYTAGDSRFCHKCGTPLPDDASFCPSCGTPVAVVTTVNPSPTEDTYVSTEDVTEEPVYVTESYEDEEPDNRKKWMLWGGIAAGVIALVIGLWAIMGGSDKIESNADALTDSYYDETEDEADYPVNDRNASSSEPLYLGAINLKGKIDGKYEVDMTLYERDNGTLGGHYKYVKTGTPIDLSGTFTNSGNRLQYFTIDEYVGGNMTGSFSGQFDGSTFSGTWTKADGSRTMPFSVRRY